MADALMKAATAKAEAAGHELRQISQWSRRPLPGAASALAEAISALAAAVPVSNVLMPLWRGDLLDGMHVHSWINACDRYRLGE